jgi:uncharacterized protein (DUF885 family)
MRRVGYAGTLPQFFEHLRTRPAYQAGIGAGAGRRLPRDRPRRGRGAAALFAVAAAHAAVEIRPTPDFQAPTDCRGALPAGRPEIGKPGIFYVQHARPADPRACSAWRRCTCTRPCPAITCRSCWRARSTALPKLLRYEGNTAFTEGWALYAESLGPALGLFEDPYQLMGHYSDEMLRAMRLVVDTGLHAQGWTRRAGHRLHAATLGDGAHRRRRRGRALHRRPGTGARVQGGRAHDPSRCARTPSGRWAARFDVARLPRPGAVDRAASRWTCWRRRSAHGGR